ncbi:cysteine-rich with EGF-like domain protein 2 isoform X2 [Sipha flava]|uniref:Cysteine-rich with EGF-like domain protein 2 isoform X2 n=1 Tax=Sipha flava TaxID=143950 RepID=A0A8B8GIG4_9HEMI|nr:cysteine-rich with EGF-like domain protein 2 isoform X2 [Sipha flava]
MLLLILFPLFHFLHGLDVSNLVPKVSVDTSPCKSCKVLVTSFEKGLERTKNNFFGGGNTAWEEKNLLNYADSEVRFVEIYDTLCSETTQNQDMCFHLSSEYEHHLKEWWTNGRQEELYQWFCVDKLKVCCPSKHYGPDCLPCKGYPNVCNLHGSCKGDGTRKGNGLCKCNTGYSGDNCDRCAKNYFTTVNNDTLICRKCHKSCKDGCIESGPKGCNDCKDGWVYMGEDKGCIDIDECLEGDVCTSQEFCINNEGSYSCLSCDQSCKDCYGDGNDMCYNCAPGYYMKNQKCIDASEGYEVEERIEEHRMDEL